MQERSKLSTPHRDTSADSCSSRMSLSGDRWRMSASQTGVSCGSGGSGSNSAAPEISRLFGSSARINSATPEYRRLFGFQSKHKDSIKKRTTKINAKDGLRQRGVFVWLYKTNVQQSKLYIRPKDHNLVVRIYFSELHASFIIILLIMIACMHDLHTETTPNRRSRRVEKLQRKI